MSENFGKSYNGGGGDPCTVKEIDGKLKVNEEIEADGDPGLVLIDERKKKIIEKSTEDEEFCKKTLQASNDERDNYKKKLEETEAKLSSLQASYDSIVSGKDDEMSLYHEIEDFKTKLTEAEKKLNDRSRLISNQECQISALSKQVSSLKEVIAITKSLLEIRNMEVKHLQEDVDRMDLKISAERARHDEMINRMNATAKLNAELKTEYETQLRLFQDLRGKYEEKVSLLTIQDKCSGNDMNTTTK